jgi:hypothetical protein
MNTKQTKDPFLTEDGQMEIDKFGFIPYLYVVKTKCGNFCEEKTEEECWSALAEERENPNATEIVAIANDERTFVVADENDIREFFEKISEEVFYDKETEEYLSSPYHFL